MEAFIETGNILPNIRQLLLVLAVLPGYNIHRRDVFFNSEKN